MKEKKEVRLEIRVAPTEFELFTKAVDSTNKDRSDLIRELMAAAVVYIRVNNGKWYTPRLVADSPESARQTKESIAILAQSNMRATDATRLIAAESRAKYGSKHRK